MPSEAGEIKNIVDAIRKGLQLPAVKIAIPSQGGGNPTQGSFTISAYPNNFSIINNTEHDAGLNGPLISTIQVTSVAGYAGTVTLTTDPSNFMNGCTGTFGTAFDDASLSLVADGQAFTELRISIGAGGCGITQPNSPLSITVWATDSTTQQTAKTTIVIIVTTGPSQKGCKNDSDCGANNMCCCGKCYSKATCSPAGTTAGAQNCVDMKIATSTDCTSCEVTARCSGNNPLCYTPPHRGALVGHCTIQGSSTCGVPVTVTSQPGTQYVCAKVGGTKTDSLTFTALSNVTVTVAVRDQGTSCDCCGPTVPSPSSQTVNAGSNFSVFLNTAYGCTQAACYTKNVIVTATDNTTGKQYIVPTQPYRLCFETSCVQVQVFGHNCNPPCCLSSSGAGTTAMTVDGTGCVWGVAPGCSCGAVCGPEIYVKSIGGWTGNVNWSWGTSCPGCNFADGPTFIAAGATVSLGNFTLGVPQGNLCHAIVTEVRTGIMTVTESTTGHVTTGSFTVTEREENDIC